MKKSGLTLMELMIANAIAVLAFAVLFYVAFSIRNSIDITSEVLGISEEGRFAINHMSRDIREAESVVSVYGVYTTGDTTVILKVPSVDASGDIITPISYFDYIIYTLADDYPEKLLRIVDASAMSSRNDIIETIAEDVNALTFSSGGTGLSSVADKASIETVTVKIITKTASPRFDRQNEIITSASLRNK